MVSVIAPHTVDLDRSKVRVVVGPFNTICRAGDVWKVKQLLKDLVDAGRTKCPNCGNYMKETTCSNR